MFSGEMVTAPAVPVEVINRVRAREIFNRMSAKGCSRAYIIKALEDELGITHVTADAWCSKYDYAQRHE